MIPGILEIFYMQSAEFLHIYREETHVWEMLPFTFVSIAIQVVQVNIIRILLLMTFLGVMFEMVQVVMNYPFHILS